MELVESNNFFQVAAEFSILDSPLSVIKRLQKTDHVQVFILWHHSLSFHFFHPFLQVMSKCTLLRFYLLYLNLFLLRFKKGSKNDHLNFYNSLRNAITKRYEILDFPKNDKEIIKICLVNHIWERQRVLLDNVKGYLEIFWINLY